MQPRKELTNNSSRKGGDAAHNKAASKKKTMSKHSNNPCPVCGNRLDIQMFDLPHAHNEVFIDVIGFTCPYCKKCRKAFPETHVLETLYHVFAAFDEIVDRFADNAREPDATPASITPDAKRINSYITCQDGEDDKAYQTAISKLAKQVEEETTYELNSMEEQLRQYIADTMVDYPEEDALDYDFDDPTANLVENDELPIPDVNSEDGRLLAEDLDEAVQAGDIDPVPQNPEDYMR